MKIRLAGHGDLDRLGDIERAAGQLFLTVAMPEVAADAPLSVDELAAYRAWVAVDDDHRPVAYVLVEVVDGAAHVEQISVHPDAGRQGIGRRLLDTVARWAADEGLAALTLITFADVPWNRPYYERLGFVVLGEGKLGPGLRARREAEAAKGLDPARRVAMRRQVDGRPPPGR